MTGIVYVGGAFDTIGGKKISLLAAVDANGSLKSWDPHVGVNAVYTINISGSNIYIGGNIGSVGNERRDGFASFSIPDNSK